MYFFTVYKNYCIAHRYYLKVSQTQLRYHLVWTDKKRIKLNLPKLDNAKFLFSKLSYLNSIEDPNFQNFITDVINSREDLKNFLLGSSVISDSIQEEINLAVLNTNSNNNNSSSSNNNNNNNNNNIIIIIIAWRERKQSVTWLQNVKCLHKSSITYGNMIELL